MNWLRNVPASIQLYFNILNSNSKKNLYFCSRISPEDMLQRIQTIYLLIAVIASGGLIFAFSLWENAEGVAMYAQDYLMVFIAFLASALLSLVSIFDNCKVF